MTVNRRTFLSRLVMAWSLWRMPTEAKYSSNNVQTIAWQHGTATKGILDISPESALTWKSWSPSVLEGAVSSTFNGLTTWHEMTVIGRKVLATEPHAILYLHCRISKSVSAANDLKIERTLRKAEKFAWLSHAFSEMSRTWHRQLGNEPSEMSEGALPPSSTSQGTCEKHKLGRVSGSAGWLGKYPLAGKHQTNGRNSE